MSVANNLLTNARSIREQLVSESTDVNRKLSEAVLAVIMYTEKVETTTRQLVLADTCVGKIRARMRAYGVPIHLPSISANEVTSMSDVGGGVIRGQSLC